MERDTVSPLKVDFNLTKSGDIWAEFLALSFSNAEAGVKVIANVTSGKGFNKDVELFADQNGNYSTSNLIGKLICEKVTYSVKIKFIDRAGNQSDFTETKSVTTQECPRCGYSGGEFAIPIRNDLQGRPVQWTVSQDFQKHGGSIDLATLGVPNFGHGIPVYPIAPGRVEIIKYQGGVPGIYGKDNHILIDHGNGLKAWYVHFMNETNQGLQTLPKVGDFVSTDTVIGHLGNTGLFYTSYTGHHAGTHLHLNVKLNGKNIDPSQNWGTRPNIDCYVDTIGDDPFNGEHAENLGTIELEFIKKGNNVEFSKSNIPAPKLTAVTSQNNQDYTIHGVAIKENQPAIVKIYEETCNWFFFCQTELKETKAINIQRTEVKAYKETWSGNWEIYSRWNNNELGRFSFTKKIPGDLNDDQNVYAKSFIYGEFDCLGLTCKYDNALLNNRNQSGNSNKVLPVRDNGLGFGSGIEKISTVNTYSDTRLTSFNLYSSPDRSKYLNNYDNTTSPEVWILSHGMKNSYDNMRNLASSIKTQNPNSVILLLDWSGARDSVAYPNDTDQWIRPTAQEAVKKLKAWGFNNPAKLKMIGHSMGTLMINEIAKEYQTSGNTHSLYYLDPPNFFGTNNFKVDDRSTATNTLYTETKGYIHHYNSPTTISRAFTGIKKNGDGNWCGNSRLNRTAKESISIYFNDKKEIWAPPFKDCKIHGNVHETFARLINDQKLTFDGQQKLNLNAIGVGTYPKTQFYTDDYNFHASINVRGDSDIQTIMTKTPNQSNQFNIWGKPGGSIYSNFNAPGYSLLNKTTLNIKTFGNNDSGWDRISLEYNSGGALQDKDYAHNYDIKMINNKPTIYRETTQFQSSFLTNPKTVTIVSNFPEMVVEGDKARNIKPDSLTDTNIFTLR